MGSLPPRRVEAMIDGSLLSFLRTVFLRTVKDAKGELSNPSLKGNASLRAPTFFRGRLYRIPPYPGI